MSSHAETMSTIAPSSKPLTDAMPPDPAPTVHQRFLADVVDHQMTVALDVDAIDGRHRRLSFRQPRNEIASFQIVTWPGHLATVGDGVVPLTFRVHGTNDPFGLFRQGAVNPGYWAEKVLNDAARRGVHAYDPETAERIVRARTEEWIAKHLTPALDASQSPLGRQAWADAIDGLRASVLWYVLDVHVTEEHALRHALRDFVVRLPGDGDHANPFEGAHDWDLTDWHYRYLWTCEAIRWAITTYDRATGPTAVARTEPR